MNIGIKGIHYTATKNKEKRSGKIPALASTKDSGKRWLVKRLIPTFGMDDDPKVGINLLLTSYLLPESFALASPGTLPLLISLLFVAV